MFDLVVPTIGRPSLCALLTSLARSLGLRPEHVFVVDDRRDATTPLDLGDLDADLRARVRVLRGKAAGPAAARNAGWRASREPWVAFVDDDVVLDETWLADLAGDLRDLPADVAASQGTLSVPLPADRAPTDWERNVAGLAGAQWITADCAYRRCDLVAAGGFDERFTRAYREDADLALRLVARGKRIMRGKRRAQHPVRAADWTISMRLQAGNADDVLIEALHGRDWRARAGAPRGAFRAHVATVSAAALALGAAAVGQRRIATLAATAWGTQSVAFAWKRIAPGPRTRAEIVAMLLTSIAIPFAAVYHRLRGYAGLRRLLRDRARTPRPAPRAVLFDRDGTLIADVPFNGDPALVRPFAGVRAALARLRDAGILIGIVSNQSGVALGKLSLRELTAVNARVEELLGPFDIILTCTHDPAERCRCRKPAPGMIEDAARALGVRAAECVVIGDIGADVEAARAAGATAVLVPTPMTRRAEIVAAPLVAHDLTEAVDLILGESAPAAALEVPA